MFKLLKIIAKAGEATNKYPFVPFEVSPGFRGKPELSASQCISCGACTMVCPPNALNMVTDTAAGARKWSLNIGRCIFCGRCEEVCPTRAIALTPEFELAVFNKSDLKQEATFTLMNCTVCSEPFAPTKEVEYVMALMVQSGTPQSKVEMMCAHYATCPECKRKQAVQSSETLSHLRQMNKGNV